MSEENNFISDEELSNPTEIESWKIDSLISQVRENNNEIEKLKEILDKRKQQLDLDYKVKEDSLLRQNHFFLTTLNTYAKSQKDLKSTKSQYKYTSLSGNVIIKKSLKKIKKPNDKTIEKIEKIYPDFIEVEQKKKLKWADLKKKFIIQGDNVYDQETGEDVSEFITYDISDEETIIK